MRTKKSLEKEIEKMANENIRLNNKENIAYEDLHKRLCQIEKERDQALIKLDSKDNEFKKLQNM